MDYILGVGRVFSWDFSLRNACDFFFFFPSQGMVNDI